MAHDPTQPGYAVPVRALRGLTMRPIFRISVAVLITVLVLLVFMGQEKRANRSIMQPPETTARSSDSVLGSARSHVATPMADRWTVSSVSLPSSVPAGMEAAFKKRGFNEPDVITKY